MPLDPTLASDAVFPIPFMGIGEASDDCLVFVLHLRELEKFRIERVSGLSSTGILLLPIKETAKAEVVF